MKYRILAGLLAVALAAGGFFSVRAQSTVIIDRLQIDLWPEYDQSSLLVIYHIALASETSLPANISLRIPARAGAPYTVAFQDVDGMLLNLDYTTQTDGDWMTVSFVALTSVLQLEYYDPGLSVDNPARAFTYTWPADLQVRNLTVDLQQPRTASEFTHTLQGGSAQNGSDGLTYFQAGYGLVDAGHPLEISFSYTKNDAKLSASASPVTAIQPTGSTASAAPQAASGAGTDSTLAAVLITAALLAAAGALFFTWQQRSRRQAEAEAAAYRRHSPARRSAVNEVGFDETEGAVYCARCGRRAADGDLFCRACGTQLK